MILLLFIICIVNLITFYNVDYKYYKEHGEWNDHPNTYGGTFRNLTATLCYICNSCCSSS